MGFFRKITEKPWLPRDESIVELHTGYFATANRKVALVLFLCIVGVLFGLLFSAYHMRIAFSTDWVAAPEPSLIWFNTLVLIVVSVCFEWSRNASQRGHVATVKRAFIGAGVLTFVFLILQLVVWRELWNLGYGLTANPSNAFFYMITGIHGLHLLGGLVAWCRAVKYMRADAEPSERRLAVSLCTLYWHFLLFVWIVMLGLFIST